MRPFFASSSSRPTPWRAAAGLCALLLALAALDGSTPAAARGFRAHGYGGDGFGHGAFGAGGRDGYEPRRLPGRSGRDAGPYDGPGRWIPARARQRFHPRPLRFRGPEPYAVEYVEERPPHRARPRTHPAPRAIVERRPRRLEAPPAPVATAHRKAARRAAVSVAREKPAHRAPAGDPGVAPGEVLCEIKGDAPVAAVDRIARGYGLKRLSYQRVALTDSTLYRYALTKGRTIERVLPLLRADRRIASAQPNMSFRLQDGDSRMLAGAQYAAAKLKLPVVHRMAKGEGTLVAVVDSGVDISHPEIAGSIAASVNALSSPPVAEPHGTGIAGVIAAHANLEGVAPAAHILAVRAFSSDGAGGASGTTADIVRAVSIAVEAGARVVNMSFAGKFDPLLARVIAAASQRGTIFVAAAGNAGPDAAPAYPAADQNVVAVTATDQADALYPAANRGGYIGVAAPGVDILVAAPGAGYAMSSGTSIAAAHVSGLVALMVQEDAKLTPAEARRMLAESARDLGAPGYDVKFGAGLIDPERAVRIAAQAGGAPRISETAGASGYATASK